MIDAMRADSSKLTARQYSRRDVLLVPLVAGLAIGALGSARQVDAVTTTSQKQQPRLTLLLATDRAISQSRDPVTFVLAVDNPGESDVTLTFGSSQVYDIVVTASGTEVWRWSSNRGFGQVITERTFPPGLTLLGREAWDWHDEMDAEVPAGMYQARGTLKSMPPRDGNTVDLLLDV